MLALIVALIFIAVTVTTYAVLYLPRREARMTRKRLEELTKLGAGQAGGDLSGRREAPEEKRREPFLSRMGAFFSALTQDSGQLAEIRLSLMRAGYYQEHAVRSYFSVRILSAVLILCFGFILVFLVRDKAPGLLLLLLLVSAPMAGFVFPAFMLRWKTNSRQSEIARGLPDALDFLVVCVEAGLGLNAAMVRVGREIGIKSKAMGEELLLVNQEIRAGVPREQALRHLAERNLVEDLNIVVASLVLADKLGTSIADTLRAQSDSLRTRVRQRAEENAARAGIKMLFPLVFMVLPTLFIVILGPALIMGLRALAEMSQR
jgi:tight adherence protein C